MRWKAVLLIAFLLCALCVPASGDLPITEAQALAVVRARFPQYTEGVQPSRPYLPADTHTGQIFFADRFRTRWFFVNEHTGQVDIACLGTAQPPVCHTTAAAMEQAARDALQQYRPDINLDGMELIEFGTDHYNVYEWQHMRWGVAVARADVVLRDGALCSYAYRRLAPDGHWTPSPCGMELVPR